MTNKPFLHAGYMTKLLNNVYEGEIVGAGDTLFNGAIVKRTRDGFEVASEGLEVLCKEKTYIYGGIPAFRCLVLTVTEAVYFVENQADINDSAEYDATAYCAKPDTLLRAHLLQVGEEFIVTAADDLSVGSTCNVSYGFIEPSHAD